MRRSFKLQFFVKFSRSIPGVDSWQSKTDVGQLILRINLQYLYVKWRINGNILKFWHDRQVGIWKWNKSGLIRYQINIVNICPTKLRNVNKGFPLFRISWSYCSQTFPFVLFVRSLIWRVFSINDYLYCMTISYVCRINLKTSTLSVSVQVSWTVRRADFVSCLPDFYCLHSVDRLIRDTFIRFLKYCTVKL